MWRSVLPSVSYLSWLLTLPAMMAIGPAISLAPLPMARFG